MGSLTPDPAFQFFVVACGRPSAHELVSSMIVSPNSSSPFCILTFANKTKIARDKLTVAGDPALPFQPHTICQEHAAEPDRYHGEIE
jgi:hypothetical protein